ncbi:MAG: hypothetical protein J6R91_01220 [Bacteroidaceae bacterium]|nr:hypothetical protein [Bacteroidaceae bacterium]
MKKISTLLVLFCAFVGTAWAQELPFKTSDAPTDGQWAEGTTWYYIQFPNQDQHHTGGFLASDGAGFVATNGFNQIDQSQGWVEGKGKLLITQTEKPVKNSALWCIVGDETNGFKFYNKAHPYFMLGMTDSEAKIYSYEKEGITYLFDYAMSQNANYRDCVTFNFRDGENKRWNNQDASGSNPDFLRTWNHVNSLGDAGSAVRLIEATDDELAAIANKQPVASTGETKTYYRIKGFRHNEYATYMGDNAQINHRAWENQLSQIWYFVADGTTGGYKLHNVATESVYKSTTSFDANGTTLYVKENPYFTDYVCLSTSNTLSENCWDSGNSNKIGTWNPRIADFEGTSWTLEEVDYRLIVLANAKALIAQADEIQGKIVGGYKMTALANLAVAIETYETDGSDENLTAVVTAYEDVIANGEKVTLSAGDVFTVKNNHGRGYMVYSTVAEKGSEEYVYLASSNRTDYHAPLYTDEQVTEGIYEKWAIYERDGKQYIFNVHNKKFISVNGSVVKFVGKPTPVNIKELDYLVSGVYFETTNNYLEFSPGYNFEAVRVIGNANGEGSKFTIEKTGETINDFSEVEALFNGVLVDEWKTASLSTLGYVGGYPLEKESAINAISSYSAYQEFEANNQKVEMAPGYYFIKKVNNSKYVTVDGINMMATATEEGINQIWKFEQIDGGYSLKHANLDAFVALEDAAANGGSATKVNSAEGATFTLEHKGNAQQLLKSNDKPMRTEGGGQVNYWWGDVNTTWYLIPATELEVDITAAGWATLHLPFDVVLPENLKAYAVSDVTMNGTEGSATLVKKTSVPANEGAILEGAKGTYKLTIAEAEAWTNNMLEGTNVNAYIPGPAYVLGIPEGESEVMLAKAALNKGADGNEGEGYFLNNANKAYLPVEEVASLVLRFNFDGNTTAIESVVAPSFDANAPIYDLSGRRVVNAVKGGLYIQNGKKFIVK